MTHDQWTLETIIQQSETDVVKWVDQCYENYGKYLHIDRVSEYGEDYDRQMNISLLGIITECVELDCYEHFTKDGTLVKQYALLIKTNEKPDNIPIKLSEHMNIYYDEEYGPYVRITIVDPNGKNKYNTSLEMYKLLTLYYLPRLRQYVDHCWNGLVKLLFPEPVMTTITDMLLMPSLEPLAEVDPDEWTLETMIKHSNPLFGSDVKNWINHCIEKYEWYINDEFISVDFYFDIITISGAINTTVKCFCQYFNERYHESYPYYILEYPLPWFPKIAINKPIKFLDEDGNGFTIYPPKKGLLNEPRPILYARVHADINESYDPPPEFSDRELIDRILHEMVIVTNVGRIRQYIKDSVDGLLLLFYGIHLPVQVRRTMAGYLVHLKK